MIPGAALPHDPIENLAIGKIIEVDGTHIVAELDPGLTELSRVYAGETYPIGQFGSIVRVHYGRCLIFALVGRLRMKAEYEAERGIIPRASADERIVKADLFGEGEWTRTAQGEALLRFQRGVATFPLPQQTVYLTPKSELRIIYGQTTEAVIELGNMLNLAVLRVSPTWTNSWGSILQFSAPQDPEKHVPSLQSSRVFSKRGVMRSTQVGTHVL